MSEQDIDLIKSSVITYNGSSNIADGWNSGPIDYKSFSISNTVDFKILDWFKTPSINDLRYDREHSYLLSDSLLEPIKVTKIPKKRYKPQDFDIDYPEIERINAGYCPNNEYLPPYGAHAHIEKKKGWTRIFDLYGQVCMSQPFREFIVNSKGGPAIPLLHEYAHILSEKKYGEAEILAAPHGEHFVEAMTQLGRPEQALPTYDIRLLTE